MEKPEAIAPPAQLPPVGQSRWEQIAPFVGMCRVRWQQLGREGRAPKPVRLTSRMTLYPNAEVHRWIADPAGYKTVD